MSTATGLGAAVRSALLASVFSMAENAPAIKSAPVRVNVSSVCRTLTVAVTAPAPPIAALQAFASQDRLLIAQAAAFTVALVLPNALPVSRMHTAASKPLTAMMAHARPVCGTTTAAPTATALQPALRLAPAAMRAASSANQASVASLRLVSALGLSSRLLVGSIPSTRHSGHLLYC
jgi:hypothetical protein